MTTAQLSQYLETAVDLEKAVFLQARRLAQYKEEIQALDRAARRPAPAPPEAAPVAPVPKPPTEPLREILGKTLLGFLLSLAAVTGISVLTLGPARGWMTGAIGGVLLGCILAIVAYLKAVRASSFRWRTYHLLMENYQLIHGTYGLRREKSQAELEARQKAYPDLLRRHQERVTQALQRKQALEDALPQLTQQLADSKAARAAHYAQGVLFPKYRTFVLVCSLCELVQSGRCTTLEGPQGAYQQLEAELQAGWILTDWNQILRQGDRLQTRQFLLCTALQEAPAPSL